LAASLSSGARAGELALLKKNNKIAGDHLKIIGEEGVFLGLYSPWMKNLRLPIQFKSAI
jgi:hypothetical protein